MKKISIATGALLTLVLSGFSVFAQSQSRDEILKQIGIKQQELETLEQLFLSPSEEDQASFAEFLSQPNTGLIRLLPREKYETEAYKNKPGLSIRGGGAYYSFARRTHEYGYGNDIGLERGLLSTAGQIGMLSSLGDTPLESVSLEMADSKNMAVPNLERMSVRTSLELKANSTYLLRSADRERLDVLVAFRIVRVDTDGSAVILWKILKSFPVKQTAGNN